MANPIQSNDLANKDVFKNLTDGAKELIGLIDKLTAETKQFGEEAEKVAKNLDFKKSSDIAKVNKLLEELTKNTENLTKAQKTRKQTSEAVNKSEVERLKSLAKTQKEVEKRLKQIEKDKERRGLQAIKDIERRKKAEEKAAAAAVKAAQREEKAKEQAAAAAVRASEKEARARKQAANEAERTARQKEAAANKAQKQAAREKELNRAYNQQSRTLNELRKRYKDLAVQNKENTKEGRKLLRQITVLDTKLKKIDATVGQNQRNVGNYSSAFGKLGNILGKARGSILAIGAAFAGVTQAVRIALPTFREYGLAIAKVKAISGATELEFKNLDGLAKQLGESTAFSATQVANLQLELSKLGFDPSQIEASTKSILDFAVATDSDLARAGEVVAGTLNAFNIEAKEAGRISDVLTQSFSQSALDLERFGTALSLVGGFSNAAGVSFEETTALLGALVDAKIEASTAATGLRSILIESAKDGVDFRDTLAEIKELQDSGAKSTEVLAFAQEKFTTTSAGQAVVLANSIEKVDEYNEALLNSEGAAAAAAETIGDTLDGDIKRL
jgi:TP901 family phage tail tape measure protein